MIKKILLVCVAGLSLSSCWDKATGQKSGVITHVTKQGAFWGTWQGELVRGGFDNGSGAMGKSFDFNLGAFRSILVDQAEEAMNLNHPVTIHYKCELWVAPG